MLRAGGRLSTEPEAGLPGLDAEVSEDGAGRSILRLQGEIDIATVAILDLSLASLAETDGTTHVVADLSGVSFMGVTGVETLGRHAQLLRQRGRTLVLGSPPPLTRRVIGLLGLGDILVTDGSEATTDGSSPPG